MAKKYQILEKLDAIKAYEAMRKGGLSAKDAAAMLKIPYSVVKRWVAEKKKGKFNTKPPRAVDTNGVADLDQIAKLSLNINEMGRSILLEIKKLNKTMDSLAKHLISDKDGIDKLVSDFIKKSN